jgi:hypothetical protein
LIRTPQEEEKQYVLYKIKMEKIQDFISNVKSLFEPAPVVHESEHGHSVSDVSINSGDSKEWSPLHNTTQHKEQLYWHPRFSDSGCFFKVGRERMIKIAPMDTLRKAKKLSQEISRGWPELYRHSFLIDPVEPIERIQKTKYQEKYLHKCKSLAHFKDGQKLIYIGVGSFNLKGAGHLVPLTVFIEHKRPPFSMIWDYFYQLHTLMGDIEQVANGMMLLRLENLMYNERLPGGVMIAGYDRLEHAVPATKENADTAVDTAAYVEDWNGMAPLHMYDLYNPRLDTQTVQTEEMLDSLGEGKEDTMLTEVLLKLLPEEDRDKFNISFYTSRKLLHRSWRICFLIILLTYYYDSRVDYENESKSLLKKKKETTKYYYYSSEEEDDSDLSTEAVVDSLLPLVFMLMTKFPDRDELRGYIPSKQLKRRRAQDTTLIVEGTYNTGGETTAIVENPKKDAPFRLLPFEPMYTYDDLKEYFAHLSTYQQVLLTLDSFFSVTKIPYAVCVQNDIKIGEGTEEEVAYAIDTLKAQVAKCMFPQIRFIIIKVSILFHRNGQRRGHANVLVVDRLKKESEHYEPHGRRYLGEGHDDNVKDLTSRSRFIILAVQRIAYNVFPWIKIHHQPHESWCKTLQGITGRSGEQAFELGYCYVWFLIYMFHRIVFPDLTIAKLVDNIRTSLVNRNFEDVGNAISVMEENPALEYERRVAAWLVRIRKNPVEKKVGYIGKKYKSKVVRSQRRRTNRS